MTLNKQLSQISETGFSRMPKHIAQILLDGIDEIANSDLKTNALNIGDTVENAELTDAFGAKKTISEFFKHDYLILNFYRGGWCPYCNMELRAYEALKNDFKRLGADILAISAEKPDIIISTSSKNTLSFPILSDKNATFMKSLGIVFSLNEKLKKEYASFGINLEQIHGNLNYELPVPGVYIIDTNFKIVFQHLEANYMTRLEPNDIVSFLKQHVIKTT